MPRRTRLARSALAAAIAAGAFGVAAPAAADDDFGGGSVIFARGSSLYRVDARGKGETEIAQLAKAAPPAPRARDARGSSASDAPSATVRALRTDATGSVLLVDLAGTWAWMPLDGSTRSLTELPCGDGPAQLADDGSAVLCRSARAPRQSILVELRGAAGAAAANAPPAGAPPAKPTAGAGTVTGIAPAGAPPGKPTVGVAIAPTGAPPSKSTASIGGATPGIAPAGAPPGKPTATAGAVTGIAAAGAAPSKSTASAGTVTGVAPAGAPPNKPTVGVASIAPAGAPPNRPTGAAGTAPVTRTTAGTTSAATATPLAPVPTAATASAAGIASAGPRIIPLDVPPGAARLVGSGAERKLVWADAAGVWSASPTDLKHRTHAALDVPLRGFLPSPDGARAVGVYTDQVFADLHQRRSAEVLMTLQLDGQGARRKAIRDGVPVEWSHDADWLLVQDGSSTCIMRISGGQYKCWRGLTAASLSPDGRWALALGNRDGSRSAPKSRKPAKPAPKAAARPAPLPDRDGLPHADDKPWDHIDEPSDEPEAGGTAPVLDDVSVAPPSGPLSLYRLRLEGAFTDRPTLLVKIVDGAAVWVPGPP